MKWSLSDTPIQSLFSLVIKCALKGASLSLFLFPLLDFETHVVYLGFPSCAGAAAEEETEPGCSYCCNDGMPSQHERGASPFCWHRT